MSTLPKVPLIQTPTPLHRLHHLSASLGIDLWMKRDDLTGFAFGGNKGRKLEYLIAEALAQKADVVVTCGALQSNFIRQLGAACAIHGIRTVAVVMRLPYDAPAGRPIAPRMNSASGNVLLDQIVGVELTILPDGDWETLYTATSEVAKNLREQGKTVYEIPVGGSSAVGAFAFYEAGKEVIETGVDFDSIVFASSSGSTQTGLAYCFAGSATKVVGICSDPEPEMVEDFAELGSRLAPLIPTNVILEPKDFNLFTDFVGDGYGVPSPEGWDAIDLVARKEGIYLDPIYSGKAFAGLLSLIDSRYVAGRVLFWHTGGLPALFAYER